jgi:hypothetical protein
MKIIAVTILVFLFVLMLYGTRWPAPQRAHEEIPPGERNLPLRRIGSEGPLEKGAKIHFRTNVTASAVLLDFAESHQFDEGDATQALLVRWNKGNQEWIRREWMDHCWIDKGD